MPVEPALGRRERGKVEKRRRIKEAARQIFRRKGYDAATTREIALKADVATATLFAYVQDKRELLMMIVNDDLDALTETALDAVRDDDRLIDQLLAYFRPRYEFWASDPKLSRYAVQQTFATITEGEKAGAETLRFHARRPKIIAQLTELVRRKQDVAEIAPTFEAARVAELFMGIYQAEQRGWLSAPKPSVEKGLSRLRLLFSIVIEGLVLRSR